MEIVQSILTKNPCFQAGRKITVQGLMLHSVGCSQPSAEVFVRNWNKPDAAKVCVHAFIDGNSGKVYQTLPWNHRAWHGGGSCNNTHIGVEMCEPACIKYEPNGQFTCDNKELAQAIVKRTYDTAVELFAELCREYHLNPLADGVIVSHKEGHARGIASGHGDPEHLWMGLQSGYTMDGFRQAVSRAMNDTKPVGQAVEQMQISDKGVELIARYEGCRLEAYTCAAGVWTIGYGHTAGVKPGDRLTSEEEAKALLKEDLHKYGGYVNACVENRLITFVLNQNQFDALTSFCYNCGKGNLEKLVNGRDAATVADKLLLYNKGGGKVLPGLVRRREEERSLFLS